MKRPVDTYREMITKDLPMVHPGTRREIIACLEASWAEANDEHRHPGWAPDQRAARRIWAGLGLLAFGRLDHLRDAVRDILNYPQAARYKRCRYYVSALTNLLPLPTALSPIDSTAEVAQWIEERSGRLAWNEDAGRFNEVQPPTPLATPSYDLVFLPAELKGLRQHSFVLLDTNVCINQALVDDALRKCHSKGIGALVPDVALYELSKNLRTYDSWEKPFSWLRKDAHMVSCSHAVSRMMRQEVTSGTPTQDIVDHTVTSHLRSLLAGLENNEESDALDLYARMSSLIDDEIRQREHPQADESLVKALQEQWKQTLPEKDMASLRSGDEATFVRILAEWETASVIFTAAKNEGCSEEAAIALTIGPSVYCRFIYGLLAVALDTLVHNDEVEPGSTALRCLDYVCLATFCRGFATQDNQARRLWDILIRVFQRQQEMIEALEARGRKELVAREQVIHLVAKPRFPVSWRVAA